MNITLRRIYNDRKLCFVILNDVKEIRQNLMTKQKQTLIGNENNN